MLRKIIVLIILLCCCAPRYNLQKSDDFKLKQINKVEQDEKALIFLSLSGGGSRAATMSWRTLEVFKNIPYIYKNENGEKIKSNLADQIDYVSGISGGSFAASAWCLYKDSMNVFRKKFIDVNVQKKLALKPILYPWIGFRMIFSNNYDRIDVAAHYYDKYVFEKKTFKDLPSHPVLWVNSTHLALATRFTYTQEFFDLLNSDLNSYPIGFACAASSAFPILLSPITLKNYGKTLPDSIMKQNTKYRMAKRNSKRNIEKDFYCRMIEFYNDKSNKWMHYADGGLVDNQGLQIIIDNFSTNGIINKALNNSNKPLNRLVIINVNAGTDKEDNSCKKEKAPGVTSVINYTMTTSMNILSAKRWMKIKSLCSEQNKVAINAKKNNDSSSTLIELEKPYCIEINARNLDSKNLKQAFSELPTSFYMNKEQIALIDSVVPILIKENKDVQRLIKTIQ